MKLSMRSLVIRVSRITEVRYWPNKHTTWLLQWPLVQLLVTQARSQDGKLISSFSSVKYSGDPTLYLSPRSPVFSLSLNSRRCESYLPIATPYPMILKLPEIPSLVVTQLSSLYREHA